MWWWDIPVRMTLIAWEAVRMIAWSYFTQRNFQFPVSSVSQPNFQFICHFFNQELNWKSQRAISLEKSMLTGRRSEQDWSELRSSNPTFDARDDGPLTHWRTPCVSLTPWLHKYISQFLFLEKCSTFKSDIFSQWWSMVQSILAQLHTDNIRFRFKLVESCLNSASNWVELRRSGNSLEFCIKWNYPLMMELLGWNCREKVEAQIASTGSS